MKKVLISITFLFLSLVLYAETIDYTNVSEMEVLLDLADTSLADIAIATDSDKNIYLAQNTAGELNIIKSKDSGGNFNPLDLTLYDLPSNIADLEAVNIFYNDWCFLFTGERNGLGGLFLLVPGEEFQLIEVYTAKDCEISSIEVYNDFFNPFYVLFKDNGSFYCCYIDPVDDYSVKIDPLGSYSHLSLIKKVVVEDFYQFYFLLESAADTQAELLSYGKGIANSAFLTGVFGFYSEILLSETGLYGFTEDTLTVYSRDNLYYEKLYEIETGIILNPSLFRLESLDALFFVRKNEGQMILTLYLKDANPLSPLVDINGNLLLSEYGVCLDEQANPALTYCTEEGFQTTIIDLETSQISESITHNLELYPVPNQIEVTYFIFDFHITSLKRTNPEEIVLDYWQWNGMGYNLIDTKSFNLPLEGSFLVLVEPTATISVSNTAVIKEESCFYFDYRFVESCFFKVKESNSYILTESDSGISLYREVIK